MGSSRAGVDTDMPLSANCDERIGSGEIAS
jgi:hypothetical protein